MAGSMPFGRFYGVTTNRARDGSHGTGYRTGNIGAAVKMTKAAQRYHYRTEHHDLVLLDDFDAGARVGLSDFVGLSALISAQQ